MDNSIPQHSIISPTIQPAAWLSALPLSLPSLRSSLMTLWLIYTTHSLPSFSTLLPTMGNVIAFLLFSHPHVSAFHNMYSCQGNPVAYSLVLQLNSWWILIPQNCTCHTVFVPQPLQGGAVRILPSTIYETMMVFLKLSSTVQWICLESK